VSFPVVAAIELNGRLVTPQRMRMIVHSIEETLDKGLQKDGQVVVSLSMAGVAVLIDCLAHE
jgi:hypothetical protein